MNQVVLITALLGAMVAMIPIYAQGRSMAHVYSAVFTHIAAALTLAFVGETAQTAAACVVLTVVYTSQILNWMMGEFADYLAIQSTVRAWEKQHDGKEMARG